jgi:prevent-host-death family protein
MQSFQSSDLTRNSGDVLSAADREPVEITKNGKPRYVMMRTEDYDAIRNPKPPTQQSYTLETMPEDVKNEFITKLLKDEEDHQNGITDR